MTINWFIKFYHATARASRPGCARTGSASEPAELYKYNSDRLLISLFIIMILAITLSSLQTPAIYFKWIILYTLLLAGVLTEYLLTGLSGGAVEDLFPVTTGLFTGNGFSVLTHLGTQAYALSDFCATFLCCPTQSFAVEYDPSLGEVCLATNLIYGPGFVMRHTRAYNPTDPKPGEPGWVSRPSYPFRGPRDCIISSDHNQHYSTSSNNNSVTESTTTISSSIPANSTLLQELETGISHLIDQRQLPSFYSANLSLDWIAGFVEAEGGTYGSTGGQPSFAVYQHVGDWRLLEAIAKFLGVGKVRPQLFKDGRLCAALVVTDRTALEKVIIPLLENRLRSKSKLAQFNAWRLAHFNLPPVCINPTISSAWLTGYTDGDGSFYALIHKASDYKCGFQVQAAFDIAQLDTERALLSNIGNTFFGKRDFS